MSGPTDKVIILGGRGMLGTDVAAECKNRGVDFAVFDLPDFDITNKQHLATAVKNAHTIINCAAYTNVEKAETEIDLAYRVNAEAIGRLGTLAKKTNTWVLHISTDFVFDGSSDKPYVETDAVNPINAYGKTKLAGEQLLIESGCRHCIIRLEWTYGLHGDNFAKKLLQKARTQKEWKVVNNQIGSPTATTEAAKAICDIMQKKLEGIYHFANQGYVSRFGVAQFIAQTLGLDVRVQPCLTSDYPSAAARPLNSKFDCGKIKPLLNSPIKPWQEPMEVFLKQL